MSKIRCINEFKTERAEQYKCAMDVRAHLNAGRRAVLVCAPVKSGKREVAQILSLEDHIGIAGGMHRQHFFLTSLNRVDSKVQLKEHKQYGLVPDVLDKKKTAQAIAAKLNAIVDPSKVVVHFDESDYGTGNDQLFAKIFPKLQARGMSFIGYSATNEEAMFSSFGRTAAKVTFTPHVNYRGAGYFLDQNLVVDSKAFYEGGVLTAQAHEALKHWVEGTKALAILRLPSDRRSNAGASFVDFEKASNSGELRELGRDYHVKLRFVDQNRPFDWYEGHKSLLHDFEDRLTRTLLVINQTCSRSTELGFHEHLAFLHDYRPGESDYAAMAQAMLRPCHYHEVGHQIRIYGRKDVFELAAQRISYVAYAGKLGQRVSGATAAVPQLSSRPAEFRMYERKLLSHDAAAIQAAWTDFARQARASILINVIGNLPSGIVRQTPRMDSNGFFTGRDSRTNRKLSKSAVASLMNSFYGIAVSSSSFHRFYVCYDSNGELWATALFHTGKTVVGNVTGPTTTMESVYN